MEIFRHIEPIEQVPSSELSRQARGFDLILIQSPCLALSPRETERERERERERESKRLAGGWAASVSGRQLERARRRKCAGAAGVCARPSGAILLTH